MYQKKTETSTCHEILSLLYKVYQVHYSTGIIQIQFDVIKEKLILRKKLCIKLKAASRDEVTKSIENSLNGRFWNHT